MSDLATAFTERNTIEARLALTKLRIARGELVKRSDVQAHFQALALRIRDHWQGSSARHSALLAARYGLDPAQLAKALDATVRDALIAIATQDAPTGADAPHAMGSAAEAAD